jgi:hypothetical protein
VGAEDVHPTDMPDDRLDAFFDELRTAAAEAPMPAVGDVLATLFRDGQAPLAAPAPVVRRRWSARAAVAGAVVGVTFGGLGIAGALPAPVQRGVADVVRQVGVNLPEPARATTTTTSTTVAPTGRSSTSTPVEAGNSGEHRQDVEDIEERGSSDDRRQDGEDVENRGSSDENRQVGDVEDPISVDDRPQDEDEDENRGSGRNPSTAENVHPDDGPQAADRRDNDHGGSSE